jgi:hypothetical protein
MFLMDDLQEKATKNGLKEDALVPLTTKKDKKIFNYLKAQKVGDEQSDTTTMRSSFYSTMGGSVCEENDGIP